MNPRYLTKSRFITAISCPTKLAYINKKEYKNIKDEDSFLASLAEGGYQVGALAKFLFKDGHEVKEKEYDVSALKTLELLQNDSIVIFEAAIQIDNFFTRIDILEKKGDKLNIYEAKAKSYNSIAPEIEGAKGGITKGMLPYLQDVAFQTWLLKKVFPDKTISSFLVMPDKSRYARISKLNQMFKISQDMKISTFIPEGTNMCEEAQAILTKVNVDKYVNDILVSNIEIPGGSITFNDATKLWSDHYAKEIKIKPILGGHCKKCEYVTSIGDTLKSGFHECWKESLDWQDSDFTDGLVLDLYDYRKKDALITRGIYKLKQVTRDDFPPFEDEPGAEGLSRPQRQWLQVSNIPEGYNYGGFYFDKAYFDVHLSRWNYPFHLIDFETTKVALPFYEGMKPYQSLAFQFSHHILGSDGSVSHADQFLCADPGDFPSYKFVRALKQSLENDNGSVFMWSHHENTILNNIMSQLNEDHKAPEDKDDLIAFIKTIIKDGERQMIDLCKIADKAFFYKRTNGSNSLKKVLPAVFEVSSKLREIYSKPIYGAPNGIPSINFSSNEGFSWIKEDQNTNDPYYQLKELAKDMLQSGIEESSEDDASIIAEGGAAAIAYSRLQFEDLSDSSRERIKNSLLRYCELDTLAMVMVLQAWKSF
jgi:hypothetical protein